MEQQDQYDKFLNELYKGKTKEITKIKNYSKNRDVDDIKQRIMHLNQFLGHKTQQTLSMILKTPELLDIPMSDERYSFDENCKQIMSTLKLSKKQLGSILLDSPDLCTLNLQSKKINSFHDRLQFYRQTFNADNREVGEMLCKVPYLFTHDFDKNKNSIMEKIEKLGEIGFPTCYIKSNPEIMAVNSYKIKLRYMILKLGDPNKSVFKNPTLTYPQGMEISEQKTFARLCHAKNKYSTDYSCLILPTERFENQVGIKEATILKKYPLTQERAREIEKHYNEKAIIKLHLTQDEIKHLPIEAETE